MKKSILFVISFFLLFSTANARQYLGTWTSHLPYNSSSILAVADEKVFCVTGGGLFYYNTSDNSINKFSRENGLSDTEISTINYSQENDVLLIAYKNANIDLLQGNTIYNVPDIKRKQILGDKNIYHIDFQGSLAYLSCGFGIVVLDTEKKEIRDSYNIGSGGEQIKVNATAQFQGYLYAATDEGLLYADLNSPNLADFNYWNPYPGFETSGKQIKSLAATSWALFMSLSNKQFKGDSLYVKSTDRWSLYSRFQNDLLRSLNVANDNLIVCSQYHVDVFNAQNSVLIHQLIERPWFADMDSEGIVWVSDQKTGLIRVSPEGETVEITPNGPGDLNIARLYYKNGDLLGTAGGVTGSWNNLFRQGMFYTYRDKQWSTIQMDTLRDFMNIEIDPDDPGHYFIASWGYGLLEFKNDELVNHFTDKNSSLQTIIPGSYYYRLGGIKYDAQKNLWVSNSGVTRPLSVYTREGDWISFPVASTVNAPNMSDIVITDQGHKWIVLQGGNGLFVFDDKGSLSNFDDDDKIRLSVKDRNNKVISNEIFAIAYDRDGNIWLGTNKGIVVYYSPYRVFSDEDFYAQQIIVPRNDGSGLGDPLLGTETVTAIAVDGANRKWIGTRNGGVFLVSEDGLEQIHSFNTENSPLLSNSITSIAINDENGEVFFGTNNGIISFVSDATGPSDFFEDVYVYPNPVREDYQGDVVVSGLMENSLVKITDLNGNLVFETRSLGGQAVWNGKNLMNERVATGVYLVFCSTEDGLQTHVTKLMFIH